MTVLVVVLLLFLFRKQLPKFWRMFYYTILLPPILCGFLLSIIVVVGRISFPFPNVLEDEENEIFSGYICDYRIIGGWHELGTNETGGYDLTCGCGENIYAPISGKIFSGYDLFCGQWGCNNSYVSIVNDNVNVLLLHLKVKETYNGEYVQLGEHIGFEDSIGNSSACHTHFTVRVDGVSIEPNFLIKK